MNTSTGRVQQGCVRAGACVRPQSGAGVRLMASWSFAHQVTRLVWRCVQPEGGLVAFQSRQLPLQGGQNHRQE